MLFIECIFASRTDRLLRKGVAQPPCFTCEGTKSFHRNHTAIGKGRVRGHMWLFSFWTQSRSTPHGTWGWLYYSSSFPTPSSKPSFTPSPAPPSEVSSSPDTPIVGFWIQLGLLGVDVLPGCLKVEVSTEHISTLSVGKPGDGGDMLQHSHVGVKRWRTLALASADGGQEVWFWGNSWDHEAFWSLTRIKVTPEGSFSIPNLSDDGEATNSSWKAIPPIFLIIW